MKTTENRWSSALMPEQRQPAGERRSEVECSGCGKATDIAAGSAAGMAWVLAAIIRALEYQGPGIQQQIESALRNDLSDLAPSHRGSPQAAIVAHILNLLRPATSVSTQASNVQQLH